MARKTRPEQTKDTGKKVPSKGAGTLPPGLLQAILNSTADGIIALSDDGEVRACNETAQRLFGQQADQVLGRKLSMLLAPLPGDGANGLLNGDIGKERQVEGLRQDGSRFPIALRLTEMVHERERLLVATVQDVSTRKRAEEALRQSEERYRLLAESVRDYAIILLDPRGNVLSWSVGAERLKGYRAAEIIGQHFSRFYPPEDLQRGKPEMELRTAVAEGCFEDIGLRVRKDGSRSWPTWSSPPCAMLRASWSALAR